ncbi:PREDICTED: putative uncharacterized protein encoded by ZNF503-AS2 [Galeopterus variegatus]|uniref:Uncharacterized protein n=1 Tax=Galeopterus variegatus TaxID=482537 RepID=A0ABM0R776_GALVR|nr:PREDICTED: putative uncharacterized protein encoded by ZNF503-AS2 [Galeopterus variegatus]
MRNPNTRHTKLLKTNNLAALRRRGPTVLPVSGRSGESGVRGEVIGALSLERVRQATSFFPGATSRLNTAPSPQAERRIGSGPETDVAGRSTPAPSRPRASGLTDPPTVPSRQPPLYVLRRRRPTASPSSGLAPETLGNHCRQSRLLPPQPINGEARARGLLGKTKRRRPWRRVSWKGGGGEGLHVPPCIRATTAPKMQ